MAEKHQAPRGTRDLDVNIFAEPSRAGEVLAALPRGVTIGPADIRAAERDGQVRVWWGDTPLDVFLDVHMSPLSGFEAAQALRREVPGRAMKLVLLSGSDITAASTLRSSPTRPMSRSQSIPPA